MPRQRSDRRRIPAPLDGSLLFGLLLLLQLPLICNAGYFSHDELQWWARADVASWGQLPWVPWTDIAAFQYRPLTFNLWLILAHALAAKPYLMHLAFVVLGSANALVLAACVVRAGATRRTAAVTASVFVLLPCVAYTHGWTATLADLLVLGAGLLALRLLQCIDPATTRAGVLSIAVGVVALVAVALLSKESAVVLPALLLVALYRHPRRAVVLAILTACALAVAVYLALRLGVILHTPRSAGSYAWTPTNIPRRLAEYLLFSFMPPMLEIGPVLAKSALRLALASLCVGALLLSLASAGWRWAVVWFALVATALAPVLVLGMAYDHYAYLASAAAVGAIAVAWPHMRRVARRAIAVVAAVALVHGVAVMLRVRDVGSVQQQFHTDLLQRLAERTRPLAIVPSNPADCWLPERFLAGVPSYRGVVLAGRVHLVGCGGAVGTADVVMTARGHLLDAPP